jgi:hypothetical protein
VLTCSYSIKKICEDARRNKERHLVGVGDDVEAVRNECERVCVYACAYGRESESERERERKIEREYESEKV